MNILWIPHSPWGAGSSERRDQHLIRHLRKEANVVGVSWPTRSDFRTPLTLGKFWARTDTTMEGILVERVRRVPDVTRRFRRDDMDAIWINKALFQRDIRDIVNSRNIDVMLTAYSRYMTGLPPFDLDVPVVFDYLDCSHARPGLGLAEEPYLRKSDAVVCVSDLACERASERGALTKRIPNGVDVEHIRSGQREKVIEKHDLNGKKIVTVIGPTKCRPPYYLDAIEKLSEDVVLLVVGRSEEVRREIEGRDSNRLIYVGHVPYAHVPDYYAASDVGLYPVEGTQYDDGRSPIKVFEYTAAGTPVVSSSIDEVERLDFRNITTTSSTARAFRAAIQESLRSGEPFDIPKIEKYSWRRLSDRLLRFLKALT